MNINESLSKLNTAVEQLQVKSYDMKFPLDVMNRESKDFSAFLRSGEDKFFGKSLTSNSYNGSLLMPNDTCICVYQHMSDVCPLRAVAKNVKISTDSLEVLVNDAIPMAGWSSETEREAPEDIKQFRQIKIQTHELYANVKITQKLLDDSNIDIYDWFVAGISTKIAAVENNSFWHGDGKGKPKGILSYGYYIGQREENKFQAFKIEEKEGLTKKTENLLVDVVVSLKQEYLKNACWIVSRAAFSALQQMRDDFGSRLLKPAINSSLPMSILGYPVYVDDDLSSKNTDAEIIFGDFKSAYTIVDRTDINVFRDPYTSKPFVEFFATKRTGGDVIDFEALKIVCI